jgi:malate dehydrogenase (oxaloacetate-decarboxylating)
MSTVRVGLRGRRLLDAPLLNKGTAFTEIERRDFDLIGLLPPLVETLEQQTVRAYEAYRRKSDDLERHIYLRALQDTNETLFYKLLLDHAEEMLPIIYTPVVAEACVHFSHIYRRPRGLFVSYPLRDQIGQVLRNRPNPEVDVIVVTDGQRILGIGDQGVGGLGIPIGKLALYALLGGIRPERTLPIIIDAGTNNVERLRDPEYLGWRHERLNGSEYDAFVDRFVAGVRDEMPDALLQWEDFAIAHARPILERYRDTMLTFNDDIQGTAAVALGAVFAAAKVAGRRLRDQTIVILGAGSAGIGVAESLRAAMIEDGIEAADAASRIVVVDKDGLVHDARTDLSAEQRRFAQSASAVAGWPKTANGRCGLEDVVRSVPATVLIGLSTAAGAFTEPIVRAMARATDRPIIFPLSNPTDRAEAVPADLLRWTDGRAIVATGSPFPPVEIGGRRVPIAQCNNVFVFPALGLGVVAAKARRVTDRMLRAAARALADASPAISDPNGSLLPAIRDLRRVAVDVAFAVARQAQDDGVAPACPHDELQARVVASQWTPEYPAFEPIPI